MSVSQELNMTHFLLTTERDKMIKACDAKVAWKPNFKVNYTAKMQFILES